MIRDPETDVLCINVKLKSGELFKNKDITSKPLGDNERIISFWNDGKVRAYPLKDIEYFELVPEEGNSNDNN